MTPLELTVLIAVHCSPSCPESYFGNPRTWASEPAESAKIWFMGLGIFEHSTGFYRVTDKGRAWIDFILNTPVPETKFVMPERKP